MSLSLILNGHSRVFEDLGRDASVLDLLSELDLKRDRVAIELNGEIAVRAEWGTIVIKDGDRVELVHFVGGG